MQRTQWPLPRFDIVTNLKIFENEVMLNNWVKSLLGIMAVHEE